MSGLSEIREAKPTMEGDGVMVRRLMPIEGFMNFDPFALWDHFTVQPANGFPDHPHRGFEAITYIFTGSMNHTDNLGNSSTVTTGGAQRFTAGSGIVHSEMPNEQGETTGIQLWINLPKRLKSIAPDYQQVDAADFPEHEFQYGRVRYLVGQQSPLKLQTQIEYQDIQFNKTGDYQVQLPATYHGFIYVVAGTVMVEGKEVKMGEALFVSDISELSITGNSDTRVMLCMGLPHGEPMKQHGPFVD